MLCFDPRLESHRALYAVSESKSSHTVPGFIIGSILDECVRLVYRFLFFEERCVHMRPFFRANRKKRLGCSGRAL